MSSTTRLVLFLQAGYYVLTGVWPLLSVTTFQMVTGPKTDLWLVQMVGALALVIGASLALAARDRQRTAGVFVLSTGSALAFTAIDLFYAGRMSAVYYADAVVELLIVTALTVSWRGRSLEARR
jgi:hypothetical protein